MNLVEKLLQLDKKDVRNSKTGTYKSGNMQQLVGDPTITIQEIDAERLMELQTLPLDKAGNYNFQQGYAANLMTVAEGVINPDLKSKELQEHFGAINASDLAKILFKTEVPEIATEIANLSSPDVVDDEELKNLFHRIGDEEQEHFDSLGMVLKGDVPNVSAARSGMEGYTPSESYAAGNNSEEKKHDQFLCTDCIATEKLVSSTYNDDVFRFSASNIRRLLNHIQTEEQNHAEMIYKYKTANNMA